MLLKEAIELTKCVVNEKTQLLLEGDIIVPDSKPDMKTLLRTDCAVTIERAEVSDRRVSFFGKLTIKALYLSRGNERLVHSLTLTTQIEDGIQINTGEEKHEPDRDLPPDISAEVAHIDYNMVNDRKINYRIVINITARVHAKKNHEVVVSIEGLSESQLKKSRQGLSLITAIASDTIRLKHDIPLPAGKPHLAEILRSDARISNKEVRVLNGKVNISGELLIQTLYAGDDGAGAAEFVETEFPFSGNLEMAD